MISPDEPAFYVTHSAVKIAVMFVFASIFPLLMLLFGVFGFFWLIADFAQIEDALFVMIGNLVMIAVACGLFFCMFVLTSDIIRGRPAAIISKYGVEGRRFIKWQRYAWEDILYAYKDRYGDFVVEIDDTDKNVERQSFLQSFRTFWGADRLVISPLFTKQTSTEIEEAFNRFNPKKTRE